MEREEFMRLLAIAYSDGVVTDAERVLLMKKADQLGIDEFEAELLIENYQAPSNDEKVRNIDGYDISDDELILRLTRYTGSLGSLKASIQLDPFPVVLTDQGKVGSVINEGRKALSKITKADVLLDAAGVIGKISPMPGGKLVGKIAGKGLSSIANKVAGTETKELKHLEIIELCERYLVILEKRRKVSEYLEEKFKEFQSLVRESKANPPKKKGLFG